MARRHERTRARRSAVQVLYTSELQNEPPSVLLDTGRVLEEDGPLTAYALNLIKGVEEHLVVLDAQLEATAENWTVARMPIVDRTILRIAAYEMIFVEDVPVSVAINEAVELAKKFGGEDESPRFVNGVLGRIARRMDAGEISAEALLAREQEAAEAAQAPAAAEDAPAEAPAAVAEQAAEPVADAPAAAADESAEEPAAADAAEAPAPEAAGDDAAEAAAAPAATDEAPAAEDAPAPTAGE